MYIICIYLKCNINNMENNVVIYQWDNWEIFLKEDFKNDTVWANQKQISEIFWVDRTVVTKHINNIFKDWELDEKSNVQKMHIANSDKPVKIYNLDIVLSIWYRTNSTKAMEFRKWANKILKEYIINWYSLNKKRLQEKWYKELENTINLFKNTLKSGDLSEYEALWLLEIITKYTNTWLLLQKYDEDNLIDYWKTKQINYKLEAIEAYESILELKKDLMKSWQASNLFANPIQKDWLQSIFWNIYQTFWWNELYETTEEKAANLLYFIVKDHPFSDWNKRSWAFLFILFLAKNKLLIDENGERKINDRALVAITLLIAESNPKDKNIMVKLVINLIN